jgi:hypothetical protein
VKQTIRGETPRPKRASSSLAKLSRPKLFGALPRERLFRTLDEHRAHPIVWVGGPPAPARPLWLRVISRAGNCPGLVSRGQRRQRPRDIFLLYGISGCRSRAWGTRTPSAADP